MVSVAPVRLTGSDQVLLGHLGRDQIDHRLVDLEVAQVDRGHAVLLGEQLGDVVFLDVAQVDQVEAELLAVRLLSCRASSSWSWLIRPALSEHLAQLDRHGLPLTSARSEADRPYAIRATQSVMNLCRKPMRIPQRKSWGM